MQEQGARPECCTASLQQKGVQQGIRAACELACSCVETLLSRLCCTHVGLRACCAGICRAEVCVRERDLFT